VKPLKGKVLIDAWKNRPPYTWRVLIRGTVNINSLNAYATRSGAMRAARGFAKRCNIELEEGQ
jgi:hypothetical protein